jgi:peroxiredoxin
MELNEKVANFTLQDDLENTVHFTDFAGKPVVLFFYPKADTPGCTIEACGFRDTFLKSSSPPAPSSSASPATHPKPSANSAKNTASPTRSSQM